MRPRGNDAVRKPSTGVRRRVSGGVTVVTQLVTHRLIMLDCLARMPDLLIRRSGHGVQDCPVKSASPFDLRWVSIADRMQGGGVAVSAAVNVPGYKPEELRMTSGFLVHVTARPRSWPARAATRRWARADNPGGY